MLMRMGRLAAAICALAILSSAAIAQTSPNWSYKYVATVAEWNTLFASKQDYLGAPPLLTTGGVMTGRLITATSTTSAAGLNLPPGTAPSSPVNGDLWVTTAGLFAQVNGSTVGPFGIGSGLPAGSSGQIQFNNSGAFGGATTGTGILTALGINVGSAGAPVLFNGALGSPSSIGTLPAFTLGANVAGGGFHIDNVVIGNVSPQPGGFTNIAATAGAIGGNPSLPSSTIFAVTNNVASSIPAMSGFLPQFVITGADTTRGEMAIQSFNNSIGGESTLLFFGARGIQSAPLASQSGDFVGEIGFHPFDGTNFVHNAGAIIISATTENTTSIAAGQELRFYTTPNTTVTAAFAAKFNSSGGLSMGANADPGAGNVDATTYYAGGTAGQAAKTCGATIVVKGGIITSC